MAAINCQQRCCAFRCAPPFLFERVSVCTPKYTHTHIRNTECSDRESFGVCVCLQSTRIFRSKTLSKRRNANANATANSFGPICRPKAKAMHMRMRMYIRACIISAIARIDDSKKEFQTFQTRPCRPHRSHPALSHWLRSSRHRVSSLLG